MTIKDIRVFKKNLALTRPYTIAFKTISDVEAVFVEVELANGIVGLGSANPSKEVVGEDVNEAYQNLQSDAVQQLRGRSIADIFSLIEHVKRAFPHKPGTLAAIDIALHDAFGQYLKITIAGFYVQKINKLPTSVTIGIKGVQATLDEAEEYLTKGFKAIKVKTGLNMAEDIERLVQLRGVFGNRVAIRIDANQGLKVEEVQPFFKAIKHLKIELIEQPTPVGTEGGIQKLPQAVRRKLAADESLKDAQAAFQLAAKRTFGIFNIKLMKCGGIAGAMDIATVARYGGVDLFWGCNDESIVSITAALHAAYACPHTRYLDLDGSLDLAEDIVKSGFILKNGYLYLSEKAGLGLVF